MRRKLVLGVLCLGAAAMGFIVPALASSPQPLPDVVTEANLESLPELIPVADSSGNLAGYAKREDVFGPPPSAPTSAARPTAPVDIPVYDSTGTVVVGFLDENGFRPI